MAAWSFACKGVLKIRLVLADPMERRLGGRLA